MYCSQMIGIVATIIACACVSPAMSQDPEVGADYEHLKPMEWLIGDWEGEYVAPQGEFIPGTPPGLESAQLQLVFVDGEQKLHRTEVSRRD